MTLRLTRNGQFGQPIYTLYDVSTPAAALNLSGGPDAAIFNDLGSGITFGSFPVAPGNAADVFSFPLNAAGVSGYNAALGGFFSIGGVVDPPGSIIGVFAGSSGTQEIVVTCISRAQAALACVFERAAHGHQAFRAKYGIGPFACSRCCDASRPRAAARTAGSRPAVLLCLG
jgi:hypothetical protein